MSITFNKKENIVELKLSKKFYPEEAIDNTIQQIEGIRIKKKQTKDYFHISMKCRELSCEKVALEFCNLLLAFIKGPTI